MTVPVKKPTEKETAVLAAHLACTDVWLDGLKDPALGAVGQDFKRAAQRVITQENVELDLTASAIYESFRYVANPGQTSFKNEISYGTEALDSAARLLGARTHEFVHALQYDSAAALHADPFNEASRFIVSPEDYILRKERLEQDAYVKGAWLCSLAVDVAPDVVPAMKGSPLPIDTFTDIRAHAGGDLNVTFGKAARDCRNLEGFWGKDKTKTVIADEWHTRALKEYERIAAARVKDLKQGAEPIVFVRLSGTDILEIGAAYGPNTFGNNAQDPALTTIENLSPENRKTLDALNKKFGIDDRNALPTLQEALTAAGISRTTFLETSKKNLGQPRTENPCANDDNASPTQTQNTGPRPPAL